MSRSPLANLTIAITRPSEQAQGLAQRIEQAAGKPLLFPLLEISAAPDQQALRGQLSRLDQTDLVIFISPNAVRYGMAAIQAAGNLPASMRVAAVGQGSAKALRECGVTKVIAPTEQFDSEGLLALPELQDVAGWKVLIFRGDGGRELLGDTLRTRGATVEYVTCYLRGKAAVPAAKLLAAAPDAITVSSSEALQHLWESLQQDEREALAGVPLFVLHERIAGLAKQQGWREVYTTEAGDDGVLSGLIAWANTRRK